MRVFTVDGSRRLPEKLRISALAAKGKHIHAAQCVQHLHTAACKGLRAGECKGKRQFEHQIRPAAQRCLGAVPFTEEGCPAALGKIAAEHNNHAVRRALCSRAQMQKMPVVKRIVFGDDTGARHGFFPFRTCFSLRVCI